MNRFLLCSFLVCSLTGCGADELVGVARVESQLTVMDSTGIEQPILSSELMDERTGAPRYPKVLVIDRMARKKGFIEVEKLQSQNPSQPRYFPVTQNPATEG